ncbi:hypothetical protein XELAEV_18000617mg, partial [Xenopus laevis]
GISHGGRVCAAPLTSYRRGRTIGSQITRTQVPKGVGLKSTGLGVRNCGMYPCLNLCPCGKIYVGETIQKVKSRISQHRFTINTGNMALSLSKHFKEKGHTAEQLRFTILETVPPLRRGGDRELKLKQREVWWIKKLNSLHPNGLNKDYNLYLFL